MKNFDLPFSQASHLDCKAVSLQYCIESNPQLSIQEFQPGNHRIEDLNQIQPHSSSFPETSIFAICFGFKADTPHLVGLYLPPYQQA